MGEVNNDAMLQEHQGGEIISMQFGPLSNYIGAHVWNLRDEALGRSSLNCASDPEYVPLDLRSLYRKGTGGTQSVTYTPRLLVFDSQHSLGSLKQSGDLYSFGKQLSREDHIAAYNSSIRGSELASMFGTEAWGGQVEAFFQPPAPRSSFQEWLSMEESQNLNDTPPVFTSLDNEVKGWPDYLKAQFHPKTVQLLPKQVEEEFKLFNAGSSLVRDSRRMDEYIENMRFFLEECDRVQGVYCTVDIDSGYGSLAHAMLEEFRSEAKSAVVMTFGAMTSPDETAKQTALTQGIREANEALAMSSLLQVSSMYVPINLNEIGSKHLPNLDATRFKHLLPFHQTAVAAVAIETVTTPFNVGSVKLQNFLPNVVLRPELNLTHIATAIPVAPTKNAFGNLDSNLKLQQYLKESITIHNHRPSQAFAMTSVSSSLMREQYHALRTGKKVTLPSAKHTFGQLVVAHWQDMAMKDTMASHADQSPTLFAASHPEQMPVPLCFPAIFNNERIENADGKVTYEQPYEVPVMSCLENSTTIAPDVRRVSEYLQSVPAAVALQFSKVAEDLSGDDWATVAAHLSQVSEAYADGD